MRRLRGRVISGAGGAATTARSLPGAFGRGPRAGASGAGGAGGAAVGTAAGSSGARRGASTSARRAVRRHPNRPAAVSSAERTSNASRSRRATYSATGA